jgi:predicted ATPase
MHGAHFIDLSAAADTAALPIAVAGALGIQVEDAQALESHIRAELRERQALLVLDNFETVLPAARWLGEALTAAPDLICLITSREMLRIRAERVVHVGGLGDDAALALLAASTRRAGATHNVDDSPSLRRLCAVVQNMPLALEMAASQLGATGAGELAASLEESLRNLSAAWRDLPRRQQSLRAAFDSSWARLTPRSSRSSPTCACFRADSPGRAPPRSAAPTPARWTCSPVARSSGMWRMRGGTFIRS